MDPKPSTREVLSGFLNHAPKDPGPMAPGLAGWNVAGVVICARCAGRIMARGCTLKAATEHGSIEPIWDPPVKCELHPHWEYAKSEGKA